ncbi:hypothetical protein [Nocardia inohanensis]|nr:hypothetical protein [Nocardia inohanensis]
MAVEWFWALAKMLERYGVDPDDVFDVVEAWISREPPGVVSYRD